MEKCQVGLEDLSILPMKPRLLKLQCFTLRDQVVDVLAQVFNAHATIYNTNTAD